MFLVTMSDEFKLKHMLDFNYEEITFLLVAC